MKTIWKGRIVRSHMRFCRVASGKSISKLFLPLRNYVFAYPHVSQLLWRSYRINCDTTIILIGGSAYKECLMLCGSDSDFDSLVLILACVKHRVWQDLDSRFDNLSQSWTVIYIETPKLSDFSFECFATMFSATFVKDIRYKLHDTRSHT